MKTQHLNIREVILPAIVCLCLLLAPVSAPWADTDRQVSGESAKGDIRLSRENVTLQKKNSTMVSTRMGKRFKVSDATMIIGPDGEQVQIRYLLVPCEASVVYKTEADGTCLLHRIEVLSIQENATNEMSGGKKQ